MRDSRRYSVHDHDELGNKTQDKVKILVAHHSCYIRGVQLLKELSEVFRSMDGTDSFMTITGSVLCDENSTVIITVRWTSSSELKEDVLI